MEIKDVYRDLPVHDSKRYKVRNASDIKKIVIHHSLTKTGSAEAFANYHVNTHGWAGIGYHYVIDKDGTINRTNPDTLVSYHVGNHNGESIGICLTGDFRTQEPTDKQYDSLLALCRELVKKYGLGFDSVVGHSELSGYEWKACPEIDMKGVRNDLTPVSDFAVSHHQLLMELGITDGTRPRESITREETWTMLGRLYYVLKGEK